ncbi:MAG TPA: protein tyrosine phosphatase family protein [Caulobacteraceae bacterium]|jgi:protein tyrosine phosphatase (PTP) superfamily phosphohydrolase (DUF442 family)|nr:protein tyrosine phosphatase family protein [Caulobacteraceae bacterium]
MDDPTSILNWRRLDAATTTSGQPTEDQLGDLKALGVGHVVNLGLHTHEKALSDEAAAVERLGMRYFHMPVDFARPTRQDLDAFAALMQRLEGETVHVHCIMNYRVSAFFYRYRREVLGWDEARARPDLDAVWTPTGAWIAFVEGP